MQLWSVKTIRSLKQASFLLLLCVQIRQFPRNGQSWCRAWISDRLSGTAGYSQTVAPAETEPQAAHNYSHTAASLDWYFRLPGGHDHHVSGLLDCCEEFPTLNINMLLESTFLCFMFTLWNRTPLTQRNFLLCSLTWCMGGSCTPIGLCLMLQWLWSTCSLVFLTMKRLVWGNHNCIAAHFGSSAFFTAFLPSGPSGSELQSSAQCFPHWVLHRVHDLCGAEPFHLCHPGGICSGADTSQGNSPTQSLICLKSVDASA